MFDNLRCEMPLPHEWDAKHGWQTKSLGCELDTYTITAEGRLLRKAGNWGHGEVPEMVVPYHGDIEFHDYDKDRGWIAFIARFTEGKCVRIWLDEFRPPHNNPDVPTPASASPAPVMGE